MPKLVSSVCMIPTFCDPFDQTYTNAVLNETLRFFSPAGRLDKNVEVDSITKARRFKLDPSGLKAFDIEEYTVPIPKGSRVIIDVFGLHMNRNTSISALNCNS